MRWSVFAVVAFAFLVVEVSLRDVLVLRSLGNIAPSLVAVLVVYISFFAPRTTALWAAWTMGLLLDLCTPLAQGPHGLAPLVGPYALGFTAGGLLLLHVRAMLLRTRALTVAVMTVAFVVTATAVAMVVYGIQGALPGQELHWRERSFPLELLRRLGIAAYSGVVALVVGRLLMMTTPLWSFRTVPRPGNVSVAR